MPNTFTLIQAVTVGAGGQAAIDFTSIPSTYTDLAVFLSTRSATTEDYYRIKINGSTANGSDRYLIGNGTSAASGLEASNLPYGRMVRSTYTASTFSNDFWYLPNYTSSNNKSILVDTVMENNATLAYADLIAGLWSQTAAITSVGFVPNAGNFAQHTTAYLYGIVSS
jgi:hypothetical protein